jgi:hypothetical protein
MRRVHFIRIGPLRYKKAALYLTPCLIADTSGSRSGPVQTARPSSHDEYRQSLPNK